MYFFTRQEAPRDRPRCLYWRQGGKRTQDRTGELQGERQRAAIQGYKVTRLPDDTFRRVARTDPGFGP